MVLEKLHLIECHQQTYTNKLKNTIILQNKHEKLNPALVALHDVQSGNMTGLGLHTVDAFGRHHLVTDNIIQIHHHSTPTSECKNTQSNSEGTSTHSAGD